MAKNFIGKCTCCGERDVEVTIVNEVEHLCEDCLDADYFYCDECGEYWHADYVKSYELVDGRVVCEHCFEDIDEENPNLASLFQEISENPELCGGVYEVNGAYFIVREDGIREISTNASDAPRGFWFPDIVVGPTSEESKAVKELMEKYNIGADFFTECYDSISEFDSDIAKDYFEDEEQYEKLSKFTLMRKDVKDGACVFKNMDALVKAFRLYGLDNILYYEWEGEWVDFYDNISDFGECRGTYESLDDEEWIEVLENLESYRVTGEY